MSLRPYPEYKDSGVDWLWNVPAHWDVEKVKRVFQHRKVLNTARQVTNVLSLTLRGVVNNDPNNPEGLVPKDYATYQLFNKNDLVFKLIDLENLRTSRVGLVHENGIMSSAYVRLSLTTSDHVRYFYHQFYDLYLRGVYNELGAGVRSTLGASDLLNLSILVPPPDEQAAIVTFLDAAEKRIRRYIRAKQKLIKLLNEQKQAIIQQAVTRGLDPDVPMKDSGVEWLGKIPAHWRTSRVQWVTEFIQDIDHKMPQAVDSGVPFLSVKDLRNDGTLNFTNDVKQISEQDFLALSRKVQPRRNDIIYACIGVRSGRARLVRTDERFLVSYSCYVVRPDLQKVTPEFLNYVMDSESLRRSLHMNGIGSPDLNKYKVSRLLIPVPHLQEQRTIVEYANQQFATFNHLIQQENLLVQQIQEYRTHLIADVVTGKVDVRGLAFEMPEAFDESDLPEVDEDDGLLDEGLFDEDDTLEELFDGEEQ